MFEYDVSQSHGWIFVYEDDDDPEMGVMVIVSDDLDFTLAARLFVGEKNGNRAYHFTPTYGCTLKDVITDRYNHEDDEIHVEEDDFPQGERPEDPDIDFSSDTTVNSYLKMEDIFWHWLDIIKITHRELCKDGYQNISMKAYYTEYPETRVLEKLLRQRSEKIVPYRELRKKIEEDT